MTGLNAPGSPDGLIWLGADQVPVRPVNDVEMTAWSFLWSLNRASSQATYSWPLFGSMAGWMISPARTVRNWFRGSKILTASSLLTTWLALQVLPPSVEITSSTVTAPVLVKWVKKS